MKAASESSSTFIHFELRHAILPVGILKSCGIVVTLEKKEKTDMNKALCDAIERVAGRKMLCSQDFEWLTKEIEERTHEVVGVNTLKRMWGYYGGMPVSTRHGTLNVLARYVGYADYDKFKVSEEAENKGNSSSFVMSRQLNTRKLEAGLYVNVRWLPDRHLRLLHTGGGHFRVVESEHSKLGVGDTFECALMMEGEPLYVGNLTHLLADGSTMGPVSYLAGKQGGVTFEVEEDLDVRL
jgi:hypothetical protein